ncbi:MAG: hypothetical protein RL141_275 [Candidatus Parcubacteria bacterium]|jgi:UDP-N-acetylmuramoylalanine--D-glutamate ligase
MPLPPLTRTHWKDKQVLILGLGQYPKGSGVSAALLFARLGARVTVTDLKTKKSLAANVKQLQRFKNVRFVLGRHDLADVRNADLIVPNQRVRQEAKEIMLARTLGIPVQTEMALFLNACPARVIGITGTRGKSTTSALIAHILAGKKGRRVWLGGNILVSPLTFLSRVKPNDDVVLELSSFQTEWLGDARPVDIAVVTNLMRDHLNAYGSMEEYAEAKAQIFRHQTPAQTVILNRDDAYGRLWIKEAPSHVRTFGTRDVIGIPPTRLPLLGEHNAMNIRAAIEASKAAGVSIATIRHRIKTFTPLADRLETVAVKKGVRYVNDTTATTPDGTIAAVNALAPLTKGTLWLILGGADKELEYAGLAKTLKKNQAHLHLLLLPGDASAKVTRAIRSLRLMTTPVNDIRQAVMIARQQSAKGDIVALSPGAASFNQFANEFERGKAFKTLLK